MLKTPTILFATIIPVSYTHLDVYKRQAYDRLFDSARRKKHRMDMGKPRRADRTVFNPFGLPRLYRSRYKVIYLVLMFASLSAVKVITTPKRGGMTRGL